MRTTLTIRIDDELKKALVREADGRGVSLSQCARDILERGLEPTPLRERTGHLRGSLRLPSTPDRPWAAAIRERNWRP